MKNNAWRGKGGFLIFIGLVVAVIIGLSGSDSSTSSAAQTVQPRESVRQLDVSNATRVNTVNTDETNLSNSNYYTNTAGNSVHSPAYSRDSSIPAGASARCRDGSFSFSQSRRGTCSHHGGVGEWL